MISKYVADNNFSIQLVIPSQQYPGDQVDLSSRQIIFTNHNLSHVNRFKFIPLLRDNKDIHGSTLFQGTSDTSSGGQKYPAQPMLKAPNPSGSGIWASIRILTPCHQASCENFGRFKIGQSWISNPKSFQTQKRAWLVVLFPSLEILKMIWIELILVYRI